MNVMDRFRDLIPAATPDIAEFRRRVYRRAPQVVWVTQRGTTIVFDVERGTYESLNDVATSIWQHLVGATDATLSSTLEAVQAEYDLPPEIASDQVERDIVALLTRLERAHLIVRQSPTTSDKSHG